ncbi:DUF1183-domain-containing protein [Dentipellis sp. KUC8613]|nr:DUF1183-domain-containing protein [Dentipellis sp. KUC8613]
MSSRIALAAIPALTFYKDALTRSRRGRPVQQLVCIGKACDLYTPDVVRCVNIGGEGTDVEWKCEADLPEALRFGRVEVSCEGWSGPGDTDVLKGSCALEYRLVEVPRILRNSDSYVSPGKSWITAERVGAAIFWILWVAILLVILWSFLQYCFGLQSSTTARPPPSGPSPGSSGGGFSSRGPSPDDNRGNPPPYTKDFSDAQSPPNTSRPSQAGSGPGGMGFWSGAALGGLGTYLFTRPRDNYPRPRTYYDWERERPPVFEPRRSYGGMFSRRPASMRPSGYDDDDRGEGPSNLGSMRRSTGYGGSNVR